MKLRGDVTPTKIMAFIIFAGAVVSGILLEESEIVLLGILASAGLLGWRKTEQRKILNKK